MKKEYIHPEIIRITLPSDLLGQNFATSSGVSASPGNARAPLHHHRKTTMTQSGIDKLTTSTTFKHASHTKACFLVIATQ